MATLTWQDVAGQVRAPDFTDAAAMITQGISGLGNSVAAIGSAGDERRKIAAAKELQQAQMAAGLSKELTKDTNNFFNEQTVRTEKKDMKEFSKNQSYLESGVRKAAMAGIPLPDFLATDKVYQSMGDGAKAYSAANLSDAHMRGDETRITMEERAKDDAYRAQQDLIQRQQWNATFAEQRRNNAAMRQERAEAKKAAEALKPKVWKTGNDKTDRAMTQLANRTGFAWNEASGAAYEELVVSDVGKTYGEALGAVSDVFDQVNTDRVKTGKQPLPENVLKRVLSKGVGTNSWFDGANGIDDTAIKKTLSVAGDQFDTAFKGRDFYERLSAKVDAGSRPDESQISKAWNAVLFPGSKTPQPSQPARNNRQSMVPEMTELLRASTQPQMVYDPHLGREIPVGSYTSTNPRPADKPREFKPSTRPRVRLTAGDVIKPPSY